MTADGEAARINHTNARRPEMNSDTCFFKFSWIGLLLLWVCSGCDADAGRDTSGASEQYGAVATETDGRSATTQFMADVRIEYTSGKIVKRMVRVSPERPAKSRKYSAVGSADGELVADIEVDVRAYLELGEGSRYIRESGLRPGMRVPMGTWLYTLERKDGRFYVDVVGTVLEWIAAESRQQAIEEAVGVIAIDAGRRLWKIIDEYSRKETGRIVTY
jgi:hypothetical protein